MISQCAVDTAMVIAILTSLVNSGNAGFSEMRARKTSPMCSSSFVSSVHFTSFASISRTPLSKLYISASGMSTDRQEILQVWIARLDATHYIHIVFEALSSERKASTTGK